MAIDETRHRASQKKSGTGNIILPSVSLQASPINPFLNRRAIHALSSMARRHSWKLRAHPASQIPFAPPVTTHLLPYNQDELSMLITWTVFVIPPVNRTSRIKKLIFTHDFLTLPFSCWVHGSRPSGPLTGSLAAVWNRLAATSG
jgi:uncharacterized protein YceK